MNGFLGAGGIAATGRTRVIRVGICVLAIMVSWWLLAGVAEAAPSPVTAPSISGTAQEGQTLNMTPGTYTDATTVTVSDQWESCLAAVCTPVGTANASSYPVAPTDVGRTIEIAESASATDGTTTATATTGTVTGNTAAPTVAGIAQEGQLLTLTRGTWSGGPMVSDQWESCLGAVCSPVGTVNSSTYQPALTDVGHTIHISETATYAAAPAVVVTSAAVGPVAYPAIPVDQIPPTISGTAQQGQILTLTQGRWLNTPATIIPTITDQWEQCDLFGAACTPIPGQTGPTYTLGPGDVGHTIAVVETAKNDNPTPGTAASAPTGVIVATSATSVQAFSSNPPKTNQTVTLIATIYSSSGNANPSGSVTFFNGSNAIGGCSGKPVNGGPTVTVVCPAGFGAGAPQITAVYTPGPGSLVDGSTSAPTSIAIGRDSTSVSLAVTSQVDVNKTATYSAALVLPSSNSGPIGPTGSIAFLDGGQPIPGCGNQPLNNLGATCTQSYSSTGTHQISAVYTGDANFAGSTSSANPVQIVKSGAKTVRGFVKSLVAWTFFYHPTYTQVMKFVVSQIANGTTIIMTCQGNGCAFAKLTLTSGHKRQSLNLLARFAHRKLKPGTRVTVRVMHPNWVGKFFSFTIRAGAAPVVGQTCIPVGKTIPGRGC